MTRPAIITVAITGALPRKADNPAVPVRPVEQIESTHEAYETGSALVHIHVRDADESPSSDPELFAEVQEGIRKHCPEMIIQFSTGGRLAGLPVGPGPGARRLRPGRLPGWAGRVAGEPQLPDRTRLGREHQRHVAAGPHQRLLGDDAFHEFRPGGLQAGQFPGHAVVLVAG